MSSTEQIAALILSNTQLAEAYEGAFDTITNTLDLAATKVGDSRREFHINQVSGDDANDGSAENPLASLEEVNSRSVWAGLTEVNVIGDYEMRGRFSMRMHALVLSLDGGVFSFAADSDNLPGNPPGFVCNRSVMPDVSVVFDNCTISLPAAANEEGIFINTGFVRLVLKSVNIVLETTGPTRIFSSGSGAVGITTSSVTYPAEMSGRWVDGVAAGEAPSSAKRVAYSSMTTL